MKLKLTWIGITAAVLGTTGSGATEPRAGHSSSAAAPPAAEQLITDSTDDESKLTAQDREIRELANAFAAECTKVLEGWIDSKAVSEDKLFARFYYAVPKTDPIKYTTDYDTLADRDIGPIQERYLTKSSSLVYVVLSDLNAYVPTHNQKYSHPLTGNYAVDLQNNRTKRIFMNIVNFRAARSEAPFLLQVNERDNGERAFNMSVPVRVHGKHWGCVRLGYNPVLK